MKIDESLKMLYVKDDIQEIKKKYIRQKKKKCILILLVGLFLSMLLFGKRETKQETTFYRAELGQAEKEENISVQIEKDGKEIETVLEAKLEAVKWTKKKIRRELAKNKEEIPKKILADNKSAEEITRPLNLIREIGSNGTAVTWEFLDENKRIELDGSIHQSGISKNGEVVTLRAHLSLEGEEEILDIPLKIMPETWEQKFQRDFEKMLNKDIYHQEVTLPKEVDGIKITEQKESDCRFLYLFFLAIILCIGYAYVLDQKLMKKAEERNEQLKEDYADVVSSLLLYMQAGLSVEKSMSRMVEEYEKRKNFRYAYEEIRLVLNKIHRGVSQVEAFAQLGNRCKIKSYLKLANLMTQSLRKGNQEMADLLHEEVLNGMEEKKAFLLKKGEEASTKMLFPMMLMLLVVMAMVIAPAFLSMQF